LDPRFPKGTVVTISGPAGSGKSHCASELAKYFGVPLYSSGSVFRKMAAERGLSVEAFSKMAESDDTIDNEIDRRTEECARGGSCIIEARLARWFSGNVPKLSFYLNAPFDVRARRIAEREGIPFEEASRRTREREASERMRYRKLYGIDLSDLSTYDFVINTAIWDKESIVLILRSIIELYASQAERADRRTSQASI